MEFYEAVKRRRTVREFQDKEVPPDAVKRALAAEGLFGCTYTPYESKGLKEFLGVPAGFEIAAVIPFGFPKFPVEENESENLDARLHIDGWG